MVKKSGKVKRSRSKVIGINCPRVFTDNGGIVYRQIYHEDKRERKALAELLALHERRVKRLENLCGNADYLAGKRMTHLHCQTSPGDFCMEQLEKPWRPGTSRAVEILHGDRPCSYGGISTHVSTRWDSGDDLSAAVIEHLASVIKELQGFLAAVKRDVKKNPKEYAPLPTLGEFMEQEARRRRKKTA